MRKLTEEQKKRRREYLQKRNKILEKYCSKNVKRHINCIRLNIGNSERHEFAKVIIWWFIRNGVSDDKIQNFFSDKKTGKAFRELCELIRQFWHKHGKIYDFPWERPELLMEPRITVKKN